MTAIWFTGKQSGNGMAGFPLDDAWIHMVYGRGIAEDFFFSYNPGVPATGATSPLWAIMLGVLHFLLQSMGTNSLVLATYVLNGSLLITTVLGAMRLSRAIGSGPMGITASGLSIAFAPLFVVSVYSGMEVLLCAALLVFGVDAAVRSKLGFSGILLGLACAARPEAALCLLFSGFMIIGIPWIRILSGHTTAVPKSHGIFRFTLGPAIIGTLIASYNMWASGRPLPATFYLKEEVSYSQILPRFIEVVSNILPQIAPFSWGLAWMGLGGLLILGITRWRQKNASHFRLLASPLFPLIAGMVFILGNVLIITPADPTAFYHQRYILPAVPLILVGLMSSMENFNLGTRRWPGKLPFAVVTAAIITMGALSIPSTSRNNHSDTRNINELQRELGEWLAGNTLKGDWVASNDAGAVRYFSDRSVIDLMGLNTPELYWDSPTYAEKHPVRAIVYMPAWFRPLFTQNTQILHRATSTPYTVTSNAAMQTQAILGISSGSDSRQEKIKMTGARAVTLTCLPLHPQTR